MSMPSTRQEPSRPHVNMFYQIFATAKFLHCSAYLRCSSLMRSGLERQMADFRHCDTACDQGLNGHPLLLAIGARHRVDAALDLDAFLEGDPDRRLRLDHVQQLPALDDLQFVEAEAMARRRNELVVGWVMRGGEDGPVALLRRAAIDGVELQLVHALLIVEDRPARTVDLQGDSAFTPPRRAIERDEPETPLSSSNSVVAISKFSTARRPPSFTGGRRRA